MTDSHALPLGQQGSSTLLQAAGAMGIAGSLVGFLIFFGACFGFDGGFMFSPLPLGLGIIGLVMSVIGGACHGKKSEDSHVVASLFVNVFAIVGGLLEFSAWMKWAVLGTSGK